MLRRAGSHSAKEFMSRLEGELVPQLALEHDDADIVTRQGPEPYDAAPETTASPMSRTGESSAYIPAVRPIDRSSDDELQAAEPPADEDT